jgi:hypothetical protein
VALSSFVTEPERKEPGVIRYVTRNSTYEVEGSRIRRVSGENPTVLPVPDGEWIEADEVGTVVLGFPGDVEVLVATKDGRGLVMTSKVLSKEEPAPVECETPEEEHDEEPRYCTGQLGGGSYYDPPEFCENEVEGDGDLCYYCDPDGAAADAAEARAEARKEEGLW